MHEECQNIRNSTNDSMRNVLSVYVILMPVYNVPSFWDEVNIMRGCVSFQKKFQFWPFIRTCVRPITQALLDMPFSSEVRGIEGRPS